MALHAVMVQLQQIEILGCNVCDQSQISCSSKAMGGTRYVSPADVSYAEKNTGLGQLPAELSDARSNVVSTENTDSKIPRKKKNRSKTKSSRKFSKEVFPKDRGTIDAIQPCVWMKWSRVKPAENNTLYGFVNGEWSDIPCLESNIHCRIRRGHDATQQQSSRKRIPVWKKKVKNPKTMVAIETGDGNNDNLLSEKKGLHLQGNVISSFATEDVSSGIGGTSLISTDETASPVEQAPEIRSNNAKVEAQKVQLTKDHFINAQMVEQAFVGSYKLQVASESVQQATGYPIAEFERLVCSASPFIASSSSSQLHDSCLNNQPCSPSFCEDQIQNISLQSIWNWYEEPGNYGLKVIVNDPQKQKSCFADRVSFEAHFVPLLSAVQLFGYNQGSALEIDCKEAKSQPCLPGDQIIMSCSKASLMDNTLVDTVHSQATDCTSDVYLNDVKEPPTVALPALLRNADLLFEFFESEQPQRRMPLYNKIMALASGGTANNQVFGDPSKLECTNLVDLHPASWFSVAWYPIYRIPEGKLRAAFLTYHSLGYMVQKCMHTVDKSTAGVVLPIIGLQSYNAQGELWFSPNSEAESSFSELTSMLLKERLGALEENALGFARGMVSKDKVPVTNRQPDYEFFMSRKH